MSQRRWLVPTVLSLVAGVILLLMILFPQWLAPGHHLRRYLPIQLGAGALAFGMLWFRAVSPRYTLVGGLACGLMTCALTSLVLSIWQAADWNAWWTNNLTSGRLAYYVSSLIFAVSIVATSSRLPDPASPEARTTQQGALLYQWMLFGTGLAVLGLGYSVLPDAGYLPLLSWAIFFVIDEWSLLEHFVIFGKQPLPWRHFLVLILFDGVIAFATVRTAVDLLDLAGIAGGGSLFWLGVGLFGLIATAVVGILAFLLLRLMRGEPPAEGGEGSV